MRFDPFSSGNPPGSAPHQKAQRRRLRLLAHIKRATSGQIRLDFIKRKREESGVSFKEANQLWLSCGERLKMISARRAAP